MWSDKTAQRVGLFVLIAIAVAVLLILYKLSLFMGAVQRDADSITANVNILLNTVNATAAEARDASEQAKLAAGEQRLYWQKTSLETYKTMASLRLTIVRIDKSLNDVLAPRVGNSLDAATALETSAARNLTDTTVRIDATIDDLRPAIDGGIRAAAAASTAMEAAGKDMSDPAIHETLSHIDGVAGNLDATSGDIRAFVHRETAPVQGTWNVIKAFLRDFAGPAAQVATSVK